MPDGGRVAFHVLGKGPAVALLFPYHVNHLTLNWRVPLHRGAIQLLARHFTVINVDFRGAGLSDPLNCELLLESLCDALDTVLAKVGVQALGLCAMGAAGLIACHFASRTPHRVTLKGALLGGVGDKRNAVALAHVARASLQPGET